MREALRQTFQSLMRPQILCLLFIPLIASLLCWTAVFVFFWSTWLLHLTQFFQGTWLVSSLHAWTQWPLESVLQIFSAIFLILLFLPVAYITATILTSVLVMPLMVNLVMKQDYADLERKKGGHLVGSLWNSLRVSLIYFVGLLVSLPLWLIPGAAVALPLILGAWMNKKIFVYDSLQDFASKEEFLILQKGEQGSLLGMGIVLGLLAYVPLVSFILPAVMGLAYAHFCLRALRQYRSKTSYMAL